MADLGDPTEVRWPAYVGAVLESDVRAVFALPVAVSNHHVGAIDLYRRAPGTLSGDRLTGGLLAAELAVLPLLDLFAGIEISDAGQDGDRWSEVASLERVEIYQATGMLMGQLGIGPTDALARLRAHAFSLGLTASEVAWMIVERNLSLEADEVRPQPGGGEAGS